MRGYYAVEALDRVLRVGHAPPWRVVRRDNPAAALPTDFAVVRFDGESAVRDHALAQLQANPAVRSVTPQRQVTRVLLGSHRRLAVSPEALSSLADGGGPPGPDEDWAASTADGNNEPADADDRTEVGQVTDLFDAHVLWKKGHTGRGVHVAVFDTGLRKHHPHFRKLRERSNWTNEKLLDDSLGHGTFVAGVIASSRECLGFAPDAELHTYRVFTNRQVSYTSWFLDAFNYAIYKRWAPGPLLRSINVINLSIGGPDFMDQPFVEKVWELSANNVLMVSAIGNDGPLYGTLNNPADQMDVIGVGGIDYDDRLGCAQRWIGPRSAKFSSRGMTTWELPLGYGRVKPDVVAYGLQVQGSRIFGGCRPLSGTSVASPVVAGAVTLLASTLPEATRWAVLNPARRSSDGRLLHSMKQALVHTAVRLPNENIFEQGYGKLNLLAAYNFLRTYTPTITVTPASLDLTLCPYMWPYCTQPLYHTAMPIVVNCTVLNALGVVGTFAEQPRWQPHATSVGSAYLDVAFTYSRVLWPWTGYLAVHISVNANGVDFTGTAEGTILVKVASHGQTVTVEVPLRVSIIPVPPRAHRLLWDQFHNLRYPPGYFPRDTLQARSSPLDWHGDHPHTNFNDLYNHLRKRGYFLEVLGQPFTCFDARHYGTLLIVDPEEDYFATEIVKLHQDVAQLGLSVIVLADWYNDEIINKIRFFDENTKQWWTPLTGGANVPALNALLASFGIQFGDRVLSGVVNFDQPPNRDDARILGEAHNTHGNGLVPYMSGTSVVAFPPEGMVLTSTLQDDNLFELSGVTVTRDRVPILGLLQTPFFGGRIVVFGDSGFVDSSHAKNKAAAMARAYQPMFALMDLFLDYTSKNEIDALFLARGVPFASVPSLEHALAPTSPLNVLVPAEATSPATPPIEPSTGIRKAAAFSRVSDQGAISGPASVGTGNTGNAQMLPFESYSKVRAKVEPACVDVFRARMPAAPTDWLFASEDPFPSANPDLLFSGRRSGPHISLVGPRADDLESGMEQYPVVPGSYSRKATLWNTVAGRMLLAAGTVAMLAAMLRYLLVRRYGGVPVSSKRVPIV